GFAKGDCPGIFHRSRFEVGNADQVEFLKRILDAVVIVVEVNDVLCRFERKLSALLMARRTADADRRSVDASLDTLEIADEHRHEIRRHSRSGGELNAMF